MRVLVTGGAGFIGSIVAAKLVGKGHEVVVLDDLSTGYRQNLPPQAQFVKGDIRERGDLEAAFAKPIDAILHFAAKLVVEESQRDPAAYYSVNVKGGIQLLEAALKYQVKGFVFSSTAAVYGDSDQALTEASKPAPLSPYGESKLMLENILRDLSASSALKHVVLRYFNVTGASEDRARGPRSANPTVLFRKLARVALGRETELLINGDDYPTSDGSPVRDFIHVEDLADLHLLALDHLLGGGSSEILNCGYGHGVSVREVIEMFKRLSPQPFEVKTGARRPGDIMFSIADTEKLKQTFNWQPRFDDLEKLCRDTLDWEKNLSRS